MSPRGRGARGTGVVAAPAAAAVLLAYLVASVAAEANLTFPAGFILGTSTAAYQIEGAWNTSGKGENIWDHVAHTNPAFIAEGHNGDVACDSYHKFKEDVALVKAMGLDAYRFSLSWSRLLPSGGLESPNPDGLRYYNALIDECLRNGIQPMLTLYHWDLPQALQDVGGWPNEHLADFFVDYAEYAFQHFGDRVRNWVTFNEPFVTCAEGYGVGAMAPGIRSERRADYMCAHTVLKAHARAYRLYHDRFAAAQKGAVGISLNAFHFEPKDPASPGDVEAAETLQQFWLGWFAHPIFSKEGDYPPVLRARVDAASAAEGLKRSRLPRFTDAEVREIRGTADFFGLNTYTTKLVSPISAPNHEGRSRDHLIATYNDPAWNRTSADWFRVVPWGFRKLLLWIRDHYDNPPVYVTENGYADAGELRDVGRVNYYQSYVSEMLAAIHEHGCDVRGYVAWSLLDNFEWAAGYTQTFGLVKVDFEDPRRTRTPKLSAEYWKMVTGSRPRRLPTGGELARLIHEGPGHHAEL